MSPFGGFFFGSSGVATVATPATTLWARSFQPDIVPFGILYSRASDDTDCPVNRAAITVAFTSSLYFSPFVTESSSGVEAHQL